MAKLDETIRILDEIREKYHQYRVEWFAVREYPASSCAEFDVQEEQYCIDFKNRIAYLK